MTCATNKSDAQSMSISSDADAAEVLERQATITVSS
jgi:hypothetical protein